MNRKMIVIMLIMLLASGLAAYAGGQGQYDTAPQTAPEAQTVRALPVGTTVSGSIRSGGEEWFSIQAAGAGSLTVETSGNTDTILQAYDEAGNFIAEDDDGGQSYNARLQITAQAGRTYLFRVTAYGNESGSYNIVASGPAQAQAQVAQTQQPAQTAPQAQAQQQTQSVQRPQTVQVLTFGTTVSGPFRSVGEEWFSIQAVETESLSVEIFGNPIRLLQAYGEALNFIAEEQYRLGYTTRLQISAQAGRTYLIRLTARENANPYEYYNIVVNRPAQAQLPPSESAFEVRQNTDNTLTITGYRGTSRNMVIPSTLYGLRVTAIGSGAFYQKNLTSLVIPNTVITIGENAFGNGHPGNANLNKFTEVVIPNSVTRIGADAFYLTGITRLSLGTGVQEIGASAFADIEIPELILPASIRTIGRHAFSSSEIATLVIPASLAANGIGEAAFGSNPITRITVPANMNNAYFTGSTSIWLEQSFGNYYISQNRAAGTYIKNGPIWTRQ